MASSQSMYQVRVLKKNNCSSSMTASFTGESLNFGRSEQCHIRIGKEIVSEVHAFIAKKNNKYILTNTSKTNPTYVNAAPVHGQIELKANDVIEIGGRNFRWELQSRLKTPKKLPPPITMKAATPSIARTAPVEDAENMPQNQQAPTTPSTGAFKKKLSITYTPKVLKSATKKVSIHDPKLAAAEIDQIFEPLEAKGAKTPLKRASDVAQTPGANRTRTSAATPGSTSRFVKQPVDGDSSGESSDKEDLEDLIRPQSAKKTPKQLFAEPAKTPAKEAKEPEQPQPEKADDVQPSAPVAEPSSAPAARKSDARRSLMASSSILNINNLRNSMDGRRSSHSRRKSANDIHLASPAPSKPKKPTSEKALHEKRKSLSRTSGTNLEQVPEEEIMEFVPKAKDASPVHTTGYQSPSEEIVGSTKKNTPLVNERLSTPRRKSIEEFAEDINTSRQLFDDADAEMEVEEPEKVVEAPAPAPAPVEEKAAEVVAPVEEKTEERQSLAPAPSPASEKEAEVEEESESEAEVEQEEAKVENEKPATPLGNFNAVVYKKFDSEDDMEAEMTELWEFLREQTDESGERLSKKLFRLPTAKAKASKLYYDVVSDPIDMQMIKKNISNEMTIEELLENFQRLFANARTFDKHSPCEETMEHVEALESLFYQQFQKRFVASGKIQVAEKKAEETKEEESESEAEESQESSSEEEEKAPEPVKKAAPTPAPAKVEDIVEEKKAPKQPLSQRTASPAAKKAAVEPKQEEKEESSSEEEEEEQSSKQPSLSEEEIRDMKVVELKAELKKRGKHVGGLKAELVKRLIEAVAEEN